MARSKKHFTKFEKDLLLTLAKPYLHIIEKKEINGVNCLKKKKVFDEITRQYNDSDGVIHLRTSQQIRQFYLNLKKKLKKKSSVFGQERIKIEPKGKGTYVQLLFSVEPTMELSTPFDSYCSKSKISKSQGNSTTTSNPLIHPIAPSQNTSMKISDMDTFDSSSMEYNKNKEILKAETSGSTSGVTFKPSTKIETLMKLRKHIANKRARFTNASSVACIETEHRAAIQHMENEERRKEQILDIDFTEHEIQMEMLREKIQLIKRQMMLHEKIMSSFEAGEQISIKEILHLAK